MNAYQCTLCLLAWFYPMIASVAEPEKIAVPAQPIDYAVVEDAPAHAALSLSPDDYRLEFEHAHELQQRGGLGHVIGKLEAGEDVTVAFLGGSITLAENGWRPRFMQWMRKEFRSAKITEVNAAVNGTGADFGAARLSRDALQRPPDLLFVEFVVNGGSAGVEHGMVRALEGIVRQTWKANPRADIVFVYTLSEAHLQGYMKDGPPKIPATAQAHEDVANHYGIPSITLGCQIADLVRQGILLFRSDVAVQGKIVFSRDGVHPIHDGAQLYAGALVRSLRKLRESPQTAIVRSPLPKPLRQDHWEGAKLYPPTRARTSGFWDLHKMDPQSPHYAATFTKAGQNVSIIKSLFPKLLGTRTPGSSLTIKFRGTMLGLADVGGPFSGQLLVSIDGEPPFVVSRFGSYNRNSRQQYFFLPEMPDGLHEVKITLDERSPDKSIVPESAQRPEQYQPNEFYLGSIMVVGEVLPPL